MLITGHRVLNEGRIRNVLPRSEVGDLEGHDITGAKTQPRTDDDIRAVERRIESKARAQDSSTQVLTHHY